VVLREAVASGAGDSSALVRFTRDWGRVRCMDADADVGLLEALEGEIQERLRHALGFQATYERNGPPSWLCGGTVNRGLGPVTEVGFNALSFRQGIVMTNTQWYTESRRPQGTNSLFVSWQTLTHAQNPA